MKTSNITILSLLAILFTTCSIEIFSMRRRMPRGTIRRRRRNRVPIRPRHTRQQGQRLRGRTSASANRRQEPIVPAVRQRHPASDSEQMPALHPRTRNRARGSENIYGYLDFTIKKFQETYQGTKFPLQTGGAIVSADKKIGIIECIFHDEMLDYSRRYEDHGKALELTKKYGGQHQLYGFIQEQANTIKEFKDYIEREQGEIDCWFILTNVSNPFIPFALKGPFNQPNHIHFEQIPSKYLIVIKNGDLAAQTMEDEFKTTYNTLHRRMYQRRCPNELLAHIQRTVEEVNLTEGAIIIHRVDSPQDVTYEQDISPEQIREILAYNPEQPQPISPVDPESQPEQSQDGPVISFLKTIWSHLSSLSASRSQATRPPEAVDAVSVAAEPAENQPEEDSEPESCPICFENYEQGETIAQTPCNHRFHRNCIIGWFRTGHLSCPMCRANVNPRQLQRISYQ